MEVVIRPYEAKDANGYLAMAQDLWQDYSRQELLDLQAATNKERQMSLMAVNQQEYLGFMIVSIRQDYVEGATC